MNKHLEVTTRLLPYQEQAVNKLRRLKIGALYMDMGTGKTRTALDLVIRRYNAGKIEHVVWLCPCSVKKNLRTDLAFHLGGEVLPFFTVRGIESLSGSGRLYLELMHLVSTRRCYLIVDESNLVKNPLARRSERIYQLSLRCQYKLILNGTPVSRSEADMYEQWRILDWRILGYKSFYSFAANHIEYKKVMTPSGYEIMTGQIARILNKEYLTQKIAPYTFQIKKEDCLKLPPKLTSVWWCSMTPEQETHYAQVREIYLMDVDDARSDTIYKLFTALQHVASGRRVLTGPEVRMETADFFADPHDNPRICELIRLVEDIGGEQAIIFAKYVQEIAEIESVLPEGSWVEFTGRVSQGARQQNLAAFQAGRQYLVANKACGAYGLNLQFCHNVIFYSNDFDFATRQQAEDRVHRIGQTHDVRIYDVACSDTIDEFINRNLGGKNSMVQSFKHMLEKYKGKSHKELIKALKGVI